MRIASAFDWWVFDAYRTETASLAIYRILFALYMLLFYTRGTRFGWIANFPDAFFHPPFGPMRLFFDGFPTGYFLNGLGLLLSLSLVALLVGYRTRWASLVTGLCLFVGFGFSYSLGKINHNILLLLVPIVMAASNWGDRYSYDALHKRTSGRQEAEGWPIALMALFLGFAMFTAGFAKLLGGWLDPATQAAQGHLVQNFFLLGRHDYLAPFFIGLDSSVFWEVQDYATVLFEVGFLFAAFHPALMRIFAAVAVFFHLGVLLVLNISFTFQLIIYALFVDWTKITRQLPAFSKIRGTAEAIIRKIPPVPLIAVLGGLAYAFGSPLSVLRALTGLSVSYGVVLLFAAAATLLIRFFQLAYGRFLQVKSS